MHRIIRKPTEADLRAIEALIAPPQFGDSIIGAMGAVALALVLVGAAAVALS